MFELFKKRTQDAVKKSRQTWFGKINALFSRPSVDQATWDELEELLISADVSVETTSKLLARTKDLARERRVEGGAQVREALKEAMTDILTVPVRPSADGTATPNGRQRLVLVVGVNGSGKTTSIAKLAYMYATQGEKVILGAADTFRAGAIEQLKHWGQRAGAEVVAHQPGSDPGAVVYDTLQAAQARQAHVIVIDTAGRLHTKFNLMEELKKIQRIASKYDGTVTREVLLVLDATTGQNGLSQAKYFTEAVGVTGIFLTKLDGTARGGIVLTICDELKIPIVYIGTGEQIEDIAPFDAAQFVQGIFAD